MGIVTNPILTITKPLDGDPVFNAKIYIGNPDTDPRVTANQKQVQARQENGTLVPISQPIRTNAGGNPQLNGSPVALEVAGNYSLTIDTNNDVQVYKQTNVINAGDITSTLYTDSGSADAYVVTPIAGPLPSAYTDGQVIRFKPNVTNSSTSITIGFPGLTPVQSDFNVIGGLDPNQFEQFRYDASVPTWRYEPYLPTQRGHDDGIVVAGSDGDTAIGRRLLFHLAPGQTGSSANFAMTSATEFDVEGLTPRTFSVGGVQLAELTQVLSHGTVNTELVANTVYAGSALRAVGFYIPTSAGNVTTFVPNVALTGSWLCKATVPAVAGQFSSTTFIKVA